MFKSKLSKIYLSIEVLLLMALLVLQVIVMVQGHYISDQSVSLWPPIGILKVSLTFISLLTVVLTFIINRDKGVSTLDLLVVYFTLTVTADILFSFSNLVWIAHLLFAITYLLFIFIRKGKWFELFIPLGVALVSFLILWLAVKMNPLTASIDSIVGAALIFNVVMCWYKWNKTKDKFYLYFAIGVTFILVSDLSIAVSSFIKNSMVLTNSVLLINWPFYVSGNIFIVCNYLLFKTNGSVNILP